MNPEIYKPIFIMGSGRSGTTLLQNMLSWHPDLAWFSTLTNLFPRAPQLARLSSLMNMPVFSTLLGKKSKISIRPSEAHNIWRYCFAEFPVPGRPLTEEDVTEESRMCIRTLVLSHMIHQKKPRFVTKYTGWSRIRYLNEIFPDSLFVHVLRDGRAVVSSHLKSRWWPDRNETVKWDWQALPEEWLKQYEESDYSPTVLAAIIWKLSIDDIAESAKVLEKDRFIEVRYEEIVSEPLRTLRRVTDFCELEWKKNFINHLETFKLENRNFKWKKNLTPSQKEHLESVLHDHLARLGYV